MVVIVYLLNHFWLDYSRRLNGGFALDVHIVLDETIVPRF